MVRWRESGPANAHLPDVGHRQRENEHRLPTMKHLLWLLVFCGLAHAQTGNALIRRFVGAPTGTCVFLQMAVNTLNGDLYDCPVSTWVKVGPAAAPGTTYYQTVQDEGSALTQRTVLNFAGAGVTCADATTKSTCTIPGGGAATSCGSA